jgi:hypothetical protein
MTLTFESCELQRVRKAGGCICSCVRISIAIWRSHGMTVVLVGWHVRASGAAACKARVSVRSGSHKLVLVVSWLGVEEHGVQYMTHCAVNTPPPPAPGRTCKVERGRRAGSTWGVGLSLTFVKATIVGSSCQHAEPSTMGSRSLNQITVTALSAPPLYSMHCAVVPRK